MSKAKTITYARACDCDGAAMVHGQPFVSQAYDAGKELLEITIKVHTAPTCERCETAWVLKDFST